MYWCLTPFVSTSTVYDLPGNVARISDSQSGDILMRYDNLNRLLEMVSPQGSITYTYDAIGRLVSRTIAGGDVSSYTYDKVNRVKSISLKGKTATYTYDAAGRLTNRTLPNGMQVINSFDAVDRSTRIEYKKADSTSIETITYTYDAGGQRISRGVGSNATQDTPFSATYDPANRLTSITLNGETSTLTYDDNGNLTGKKSPTGTTTYTWTARNQLAQITAPSLTASFKYDALGRRTEKTVNGNTTGFLYDGSQAIAELKANAIDTVYHTGLQIDEVLARYGSTGNRTLLTDALMSVIAQANDAEGIENYYNYSPYGQAQATGVDGGNSLQYTGRENDQTGLYYYRARYYDPVLKRFISEDPIGVAGGINLYAYVGGNPVSRADPSGLWEISFGGYGPWGGEMTFGRDPQTGQGFITCKIGFGAGGGFSYDPLGGRPGGNEKGADRGGGVTVGIFGEAGGAVGPVTAKVQGQAGLDFGSSGITYSSSNPNTSVGGTGGGVQAVGAVGVQFSIYGSPSKR